MLLRGGSRTVSELAAALALTSNAVRIQLTGLERDGLIRVSGSRPGTRKPTIIYDLAPEAERLFPKIYGPVLRYLMDELAERLPPKKVEQMTRAVGHRLAAEHRLAVKASNFRDRVAQAVTLLCDWGGFCESEGQNGKIIVRCSHCPLALVAAGHPEMCRLLETALAELLNVPVQQRCQTEPTLQCYFEIAAPLVETAPR